MSVIHIQRTHQLTASELRSRIEVLMVKISHRLEFNSEWETERTLYFKRKGASGSIHFSDNQFELTIRLGMMFRALKGVIAKEVEAEIDQQFN